MQYCTVKTLILASADSTVDFIQNSKIGDKGASLISHAISGEAAS